MFGRKRQFDSRWKELSAVQQSMRCCDGSSPTRGCLYSTNWARPVYHFLLFLILDKDIFKYIAMKLFVLFDLSCQVLVTIKIMYVFTSDICYTYQFSFVTLLTLNTLCLITAESREQCVLTLWSKVPTAPSAYPAIRGIRCEDISKIYQRYAYKISYNDNLL